LGVSLAKRMFGRVGDDRAQRVRLRRLNIGIATYAIWFSLSLLAWVAGLLRASGLTLLAIGVGIFISQATFYLLIRSGRNLKFADPALTFQQVCVGMVWAIALLAFTNELRGLLLSVLMVALLFGIFAFDRRQFTQLASLAGAGYLGLMLFERATEPGRHPDAYYLISTLIVVGAMVWTTMFGAYVSAMRQKLSSRNEDLRFALQRISELAERDDLTGLHNRRYIMDVLSGLLARAERDGQPFSICIIDLDHFKRINDRFGHAAGDQVLVAFSRLVESELRGMDFVAHNVADGASFGRYGGEEFILLLPATRLDGAQTCAERLRAKQAAARHPAAPIVTLSAGIAEHRPGEDSESLLRRADRALYEAKYAGRNRVHRAAA
jgi:diguanylate cyclase (GGDEF)-like protein